MAVKGESPNAGQTCVCTNRILVQDRVTPTLTLPRTRAACGGGKGRGLAVI
jgi:acyl-CoA reductase-like NAD-dependent aldehyde dehydrogenase